MAKTVDSKEHFVKSSSKVFEQDSPEVPEEWDYDYIEEEEEDEGEGSEKKIVIQISPSQFTETAFRMPDKVNNTYVPFSFKGREYLRTIYDIDSKRTLLKCGRQVEKSSTLFGLVSMYDGSLKPIKDIKVGDRVITYDPETQKMLVKKVVWVSRIYTKPCIRLKTRRGLVNELALTHPLRRWDKWVPAGELKVKDRVAAIRRGGEFVGEVTVDPYLIKLVAYMIGDGCMTFDLSFTALPGKALDEFKECVVKIGGTYKQYNKPATEAKKIRLHKSTCRALFERLKKDGLYGCNSRTKFIPDWVFKLSKEGTALFLNRLWATDGHVKKNTNSKYSIEYASTSSRLIKQLQALLWKFGVPSKIRENRSRDDGKAHILRIETQNGIYTFLKEIGAYGKSEDIPLPSSDENNNRDTFPIEINDLIRRIVASKGSNNSYGRSADHTLNRAGLRNTIKYPPTRAKLREYLESFRSDPGYDQRLVKELENHVLNHDVLWDEIVEIEEIGEQECIDIEVEDTHNFICDGLVSHNSTLLGNKLLSYCCLISALNALYVSPTNQQTKVFSRDRIKEPIETSEYLKSWISSRLADNIFLKKLINRSQITLRYAYANADRVRGIPADLICLDEIQDILTDNIPVIEECASHSPFKIFIYSGTPKSLDNTIEHYWTNQSTQNEWVVPCYRHNITTSSGTTNAHWNILDEENIGQYSLICDKCGEQIFPTEEGASWVSMNPKIREEISQPYEGFRIPQLMVPWITWEEILQKQKTYSRAKFYNEVLGLSYDSGTRPITRQDLIDNCDPNLLLTDEAVAEMHRRTGGGHSSMIFCGIDWGSGENTYTVLTLGTYINGKFTIFYIRRFEGPESEPSVQMDIISKIIEEWNVSLVGVDYGGGFWPNDELIRRFGHTRVAKYQYSTPNVKVRWDDGLKRWIVNRTEVMSDVFNAIKRRDVFRFPSWDAFEHPFGQDFLNIFSEYSEQRRVNEYKKSPNSTDDSFHAVLLCFIVSMIRFPRPDVIAPSKGGAQISVP